MGDRPGFYRGEDDWRAIVERLKHTPCPHCHTVGALIRHGTLSGFDDSTPPRRTIRARRVFCSNRHRRRGCGRTFSVRRADTVRRLSLRDGTLTHRRFVSHHLGGIRAGVYVLLRRGRACRCATTAGVCRELLARVGALYTFAAVEGVEPTNNAAERALRHAVCWRKTSYGTDSATGSRFVERVLTAVASCRQQGRDVLAFLTDAIQAARTGGPPPSLIPATP